MTRKKQMLYQPSEIGIGPVMWANIDDVQLQDNGLEGLAMDDYDEPVYWNEEKGIHQTEDE